MYRRMNMTIVDGDLLDQDVEVIVNAWNRNVIPWWLLVPQGVSGAINVAVCNRSENLAELARLLWVTRSKRRPEHSHSSQLSMSPESSGSGAHPNARSVTQYETRLPWPQSGATGQSPYH